MIRTKNFHVAIPTAFNLDESLNTDLTLLHIKRIFKYGVETVMVCGSTGEQHSMSLTEKCILLTAIDQYITNSIERPDVIWGIAAIRLTEALSLAEEVRSSCVSAILLGFPPYIRPTQIQALNYALKIIERSNKPVIIYNNPARTGFDLSIESCIELCNHPMVFGLKEAGDVNKVQILKEKISKSNFLYFSGGEVNLSEKIANGFNALSSISGNINPLLVKSYFEGKIKNILIEPEMENNMKELVESIFEDNPISKIKQILLSQGFNLGICRSPL